MKWNVFILNDPDYALKIFLCRLFLQRQIALKGVSVKSLAAVFESKHNLNTHHTSRVLYQHYKGNLVRVFLVLYVFYASTGYIFFLKKE